MSLVAGTKTIGPNSNGNESTAVTTPALFTSRRGEDDDNDNAAAMSRSSAKESTGRPHAKPSTAADDSTTTITSQRSVRTAKGTSSHKSKSIAMSSNSTDDNDLQEQHHVTGGISEWDLHHDETSAMDLQYNVTAPSNATTMLLPPEPAQTESWSVIIFSVFSALAVGLCAATCLRRCRQRRRGYQEIQSLVV